MPRRSKLRPYGTSMLAKTETVKNASSVNAIALITLCNMRRGLSDKCTHVIRRMQPYLSFGCNRHRTHAVVGFFIARPENSDILVRRIENNEMKFLPGTLFVVSVG